MLYDALHGAIRALEHTGPAGFEGLVRDLFAEVTGQGFRVMKAGPQGGVDVLGDATGSGLVIGVEGKHYDSKTTLPLDSLKSKVHDAAARFPSMDLWVLATTRAISAGDVEELERLGAELGLDVLILDWDEGAIVPPPLAVLSAMAPAAAQARLKLSPKAGRDLDDVRAHPRFADLAARLRDRLHSPLVGYGAARAKLNEWLRAHMRDGDEARLAFDSYANLNGPGVRRIERETVSSPLNTWWSGPKKRPLMVLGEEGVGKTWAVLSWWLESSAKNPQFPLTIFVPAKDVNTADALSVLARTLSEALSVRDSAFWERRIRRWLASDTGAAPALLVVVDGLNQNWLFNEWSTFALKLAGGERKGRVALAMTCRPDHFHSRMQSLSDLPEGVDTLKVERFSDDELKRLLATYGMKPEDFPPRLLDLMRVPRLCHLAIARRNELRDSGDITPERLVYEEWRHRQPRALQALSHEEFKAFVTQLGRSAIADLDQTTLTRAELLNRLSAESGNATETYQGILSEVIDGGWLTPTDKPHQFRIQTERLPYALGLVLVDELRSASSVEEAQARIGPIFDLLQGADISVSILRCAATMALIEPKIPAPVKQALLAHWLGAQNFLERDFEAFWRCIGCAPDAILDTAEALWFGDGGRGREDEVLVKGFANAWQWQNVSEATEERLTKWFSRYWLDPRIGEVIGTVPDDEAAAQRREASRQRAGAWNSEPAATAFGFTVSECEAHRQAWGSYRAVEMMSWLPRSALIRPLTAWAATRSIMGSNRQQEKLAWVLRWNQQDAAGAETAILDRAHKLLGFKTPMAHEVAKLLLGALATPRGQALYDQISGARSQDVLPKGVRWDLEHTLRWPRCIEAPLEATLTLQADPEDPQVELSDEQRNALRELGNAVTEEQLLAEVNGGRDGGFQTGRLALARWAPDVRVALERRRFRAALPAISLLRRIKRGVVKLIASRLSPADFTPPLLTHRLPDAVLALTDEDIAPWRRLADEERMCGATWTEGLQAAALAGATPVGQVAVLHESPPAPS